VNNKERHCSCFVSHGVKKGILSAGGFCGTYVSNALASSRRIRRKHMVLVVHCVSENVFEKSSCFAYGLPQECIQDLEVLPRANSAGCDPPAIVTRRSGIVSPTCKKMVFPHKTKPMRTQHAVLVWPLCLRAGGYTTLALPRWIRPRTHNDSWFRPVPSIPSCIFLNGFPVIVLMQGTRPRRQFYIRQRTI
jgi:hypothetical protein